MTTGGSTTMYQKGDIVLLPFPFTDLSAARTRPGVVVSVEGFQRDAGDFTVAMITSVPRTTPYDYELKDWQGAHLLRPSWVRAKLATLDPALVRYKPGRLSDADLAEVERRIRLALGLP
jgi:mRNA interferase MazF